MPAFDTYTDATGPSWPGHVDCSGQFAPDEAITAQEYGSEPQATAPDELDDLNIMPEDEEEPATADERGTQGVASSALSLGALTIEASESDIEEPKQDPLPRSAEADHDAVDEPAAGVGAKLPNDTSEASSDAETLPEPPALAAGGSGNNEPPEGPPPPEALSSPGDEPERPDDDDDTDYTYEWEGPSDPSGGDEQSVQPSGPAHNAYHTLHPVGRYVAKDRSAGTIGEGQTVSIPTGIIERTGFTKGNEKWITNQSADEYRENLFADDIPGATPETTKIAGGEAGALAAGRVVLDVGSGEAVALSQFAERYPDTTFIGVDQFYDKAREIDVTKPGVQLTKDDWHNLAHIPSDSVDTVLSQRAVVPWGVGPNDPRSGEVVDAITRVAKEGAVWRLDVLPETNWRTYITPLLEERGWHVIPVADARGGLRYTMVAIKKGRSEQTE